MTDFITFFTNNWKELVPIILSVIALTISINTELRLKPTLDVTFEEELFLTPEIITTINRYDHPDGFFGIYLKVVNPSDIDIAFFDLIVLDADTLQKNYQIFTQLVLDGGTVGQYRFLSNGTEVNLNAPKTNYGIFKAHSYTRYEVLFDLGDELPENIRVRFKISIKSRRSIPNTKYRKKFKYYSATYNLKSGKRTK